MFRPEERATQEARIAHDIRKQQPDISWAEALRIAKKWVDKDRLTSAPRPTYLYVKAE
jgi:hypothetical protein